MKIVHLTGFKKTKIMSKIKNICIINGNVPMLVQYFLVK